MEQIIDRDGTTFTDLVQLSTQQAVAQLQPAVADYKYAIDMGMLSFID